MNILAVKTEFTRILGIARKTLKNFVLWKERLFFLLNGNRIKPQQKGVGSYWPQ